MLSRLLGEQLQGSFRNELGEAEFQCRGNACCKHDADVLQAPLDGAHVRPINRRIVGKSLLRDAKFKAPFSYSETERNEFCCVGMARRRTRHVLCFFIDANSTTDDHPQRPFSSP